MSLAYCFIFLQDASWNTQILQFQWQVLYEWEICETAVIFSSECTTAAPCQRNDGNSWKFTTKVTSFQDKVYKVCSVVLGRGRAVWYATESNICPQQTRVATQCCWLPSCNCRWINCASHCCSLWWHSWCKYTKGTLQCMKPDYTHSIDRQDVNITNIPAARLSQCLY